LRDLFQIAAMLPWWAWLALAVAVYGVLHHHAVAELPTGVAPQHISQLIIPAAAKGFCHIWPICCSATLRGRGSGVVSRAAQAQRADP